MAILRSEKALKKAMCKVNLIEKRIKRAKFFLRKKRFEFAGFERYFEWTGQG